MDIETFERLARRGDASKEAAAHRFRAAIMATTRTVAAFARASKQGRAAIGNALAGDNFPSRKSLLYLYRAERIDFNYSMIGDVTRLPGDVQLRLFVALEALESGSGQIQD